MGTESARVRSCSRLCSLVRMLCLLDCLLSCTRFHCTHCWCWLGKIYGWAASTYSLHFSPPAHNLLCFFPSQLHPHAAAHSLPSMAPLLALVLLVLAPVVLGGEAGGEGFNYTFGGADWPGLCSSGEFQSPINIVTRRAAPITRSFKLNSVVCTLCPRAQSKHPAVRPLGPVVEVHCCASGVPGTRCTSDSETLLVFVPLHLPAGRDAVLFTTAGPIPPPPLCLCLFVWLCR